ncbi:class GN sortase [Magnetospira sp. QH-2]|uniref:class GN sortase n=1 Tax=Magnetospira sp. (strain QH-2) TaxID=1288970 RepID=UPI0006986262|nr:class GN sortase [Magnetospira sp. QH-2]
MSGRLRLMAGTVLLGLGLWQAGSGALIEAKAWLGQHLIRSAWAESLTSGQLQEPWPWADTHPVARLEVPRLGIDLIVLAGATGRTIAWGPGHQDGSQPPNGPGTTVIAGHRDTHMAFLRELIPGDSLRLTDSAGWTRTYRVLDGFVVHEDEAAVRSDPEDPRLMLLTCWPFEALVPGGPLRYVVEAERV